MLTEKLLHVGRVTVRINDDRARASNQTVGDDDFLDDIRSLLSEKFEQWFVLLGVSLHLFPLRLRILITVLETLLCNILEREILPGTDGRDEDFVPIRRMYQQIATHDK